MAGGKRASMREGPLAALFQRTDVEPADGQPKAPDIEAEDQYGKRFKLSEYRGKVVLLDFWSYV